MVHCRGASYIQNHTRTPWVNRCACGLHGDITEHVCTYKYYIICVANTTKSVYANSTDIYTLCTQCTIDMPHIQRRPCTWCVAWAKVINFLSRHTLEHTHNARSRTHRTHTDIHTHTSKNASVSKLIQIALLAMRRQLNARARLRCPEIRHHNARARAEHVITKLSYTLFCCLILDAAPSLSLSLCDCRCPTPLQSFRYTAVCLANARNLHTLADFLWPPPTSFSHIGILHIFKLR